MPEAWLLLLVHWMQGRVTMRPRVSAAQVLILCSIGLWMLLWGIPGLLLAIPLTCIVRIVFEYLSETRPDLPYVAFCASIFRGASVDAACLPEPERQQVIIAAEDRKMC